MRRLDSIHVHMEVHAFVFLIPYGAVDFIGRTRLLCNVKSLFVSFMVCPFRFRVIANGIVYPLTVDFECKQNEDENTQQTREGSEYGSKRHVSLNQSDNWFCWQYDTKENAFTTMRYEFVTIMNSVGRRQKSYIYKMKRVFSRHISSRRKTKDGNESEIFFVHILVPKT